MPKKITYLLLTFPKLTTTFVDREILALRESGTDVQIYALHRPNGPLSQYQEPLLEETHYIYPASVVQRIKAQMYYAFRHPCRYFGTLAYLLTRKHPTFLSHRRTFHHFLQGIYVTYVLRKDPGDHIHAHFLNQIAIIALIVQRMLDVPYSVTVHASGEFFSTPMMVREKLAEAKFIATCTKYNRDHLEEVGKDLFDGKVLVNYHGLDVEKYRRNTPKPVSPPVILSVGQLRERKGQIYMVQACAILQEHGLDFRCRIIGEGPEREALEGEIRRLGLSEKVTLVGSLPQEQVIHEYEAASLFVLPTVLSESGDRDGIPNVILEAMAMELPVVSTWNSAIPEAVKDGENGLLVPPRDVPALAKALEKILTDPSFAVKLAGEACKTVREQFDPQRNIQVLVKAFQE